MIWTKDIPTLENKFQVYIFSILDIEEMSDVQVRYMFFDKILYDMGIFHNFFFEPIKNAKPTG